MTLLDGLNFLLGLSLFLFGMNLMGESLKKSVGRNLKGLLERLTSRSWQGFLLGILVTAVIQSSSVTTVMTVGFVNSGTLSFARAVGIIFGANVGSSVTSWLTALASLNGTADGYGLWSYLKPSSFVPIAAFVGFLLCTAGKNDRKKAFGFVLCGFSVLMLGMDTMSESVSALSENETFRSILVAFENPILGLLAGLVLTAVIQSSSASVGILQSFTVTGVVTFGNAVPIIMGQNIGTCITAFLASAGSNKEAKRTASVHLFFNVFGSLLGLTAFAIFRYGWRLDFFEKIPNMWDIAVLHTLFNCLTAAVLLPFSKGLEKLSVWVIRDRGEGEAFCRLDERWLATPSVAVEQSRLTADRMATEAVEALRLACALLNDYSEKTAEQVRKKEEAVDQYEDELGNYLIRIAECGVLEEEGREVTQLLHAIGDWERICDHAVRVAQAAEEMHGKKLSFSPTASEELSVLIRAVCELSDLTQRCVRFRDLTLAESVEPLAEVAERLTEEIRRNHILRLQNHQCSVEQGFVLQDILVSLERVAAHCSRVAGCLSDLSRRGKMDLHRYLREYRQAGSGFEEKRKFFAKKYRLKDRFDTET